MARLRAHLSKCLRGNPSYSAFDDVHATKQIGELLGYPTCCMDFFIKHRSSEEKPEVVCYKSLMKLLKSEDKGDYLPLLKSFFAFEFYPCGPYCKEAEKIGSDILERLGLEEKRLSEAFILAIILNINRALHPAMAAAERGKMEQEIDNEIYRIVVGKGVS